MIYNSLESIFTQNRRYVDLFKEISQTVTSEHVEEAMSRMAHSDIEMSFIEIMEKVKVLDNELRRKAIWCMDSYKEEKGRGSVNLSRSCKKIIKQCTVEYVYRVKTLLAIQKSSHPLGSTFPTTRRAS